MSPPANCPHDVRQRRQESCISLHLTERFLRRQESGYTLKKMLDAVKERGYFGSFPFAPESGAVSAEEDTPTGRNP